jgi:hypothetical protein
MSSFQVGYVDTKLPPDKTDQLDKAHGSLWCAARGVKPPPSSFPATRSGGWPAPRRPSRVEAMVGVGYGKGAPIDEGKVRWVTPEELDGLRAGGASLRILDARDDTEFQAGTIPGAMSCGQTAIMFTTGQVKPLLDEVVAGPEGERIVLFANTAGPNTGMTAGREVYVMSYLHELGPRARTHRTRSRPSRSRDSRSA